MKNKSEKKVEMKTPQTELGKMLSILAAMGEEIPKGFVPMCVIAAKAAPNKEKRIDGYIATIDDGDGTAGLLYKLFKDYVERYEAKDPTLFVK